VAEEARVLEVGLTDEQIIAAVKRMKKTDREEFIEDLLSATSPEYLKSIREARNDRKAGRVKSLEEVLGE
jgi:PHD/YefM family antitoxin component YafN of YafNO toxin-antitoxin module